MQQPTGSGPPDFRLKFIHGTRFGGIKGYGIGWRVHHHGLVKNQQWNNTNSTTSLLKNERRPPVMEDSTTTTTTTIGRGGGEGRHKKKHKHRRRRHHNPRRHKNVVDSGMIREKRSRMSHGTVTDIGAPESMWGPIAYNDRVRRNRHHQRSFGRMYGNFNHHSRPKQMQIASATPRTYVNSREFESRYLGNVQHR